MTDRSKSNDSDSFAAALRVLTRADRSEAELRRKLQQFGFDLCAIDNAVERCRNYNYLNDERYAVERARALMRSGRGVGTKVRLDLRQRGLADEHIEAAMSIVEGEFSSTTLLREQLQRRFSDFDYSTADDKKRRRVINYFRRRGFSFGEIIALLKNESHI